LTNPRDPAKLTSHGALRAGRRRQPVGEARVIAEIPTFAYELSTILMVIACAVGALSPKRTIGGFALPARL